MPRKSSKFRPQFISIAGRDLQPKKPVLKNTPCARAVPPTPPKGHANVSRGGGCACVGSASRPIVALTIQQVADAWHARTGQRLSRSRVHQILDVALAKLRRALESEARP